MKVEGARWIGPDILCIVEMKVEGARWIGPDVLCIVVKLKLVVS